MNFEKLKKKLLRNRAIHDAKLAQLAANQAKRDAALGNNQTREAEIGEVFKMQAKNEQWLGELVKSVTNLTRIARTGAE